MNEVSLYIPCFNAERTIARCLEATLKQAYPLKEILVIDDGSTDGSGEIVSRYPVKIIRHIANMGLAATRNDAIKNVRADFIASLDADCEPEKDWLKNLMKAFTSKCVAGAGGRLVEAYQTTAADAWRSVHMKQDWEDQKNKPPFLYGSNVVFRKDALLSVGLYDQSLGNNYEDVDVSMRLRKSGYELVYEPYARAFHLKKDTSYSVLNNFWQWHLSYHKAEGWFNSRENFVKKIDDSIGLANRFLVEDVAQGRNQLVFLDFLLSFHHCIKDFEFLNYKDKARYIDPVLPLWLSLIDLTFFYHLKKRPRVSSTLLATNHAFLQNLIAFTIISGAILKGRFKTQKIQRELTNILLLSLYTIEDSELLKRISNVIELHDNWADLCNQSIFHLDSFFLQTISASFEKWLDSLEGKYYNAIEMASSAFQASTLEEEV